MGLCFIIKDIYFSSPIHLAGPSITDLVDMQYLEENFAKERFDFVDNKHNLDVKANKIVEIYESAIGKVEIRENGEAQLYKKENLLSFESSRKMEQMYKMNSELIKEANNLLKKVSDLETLDKQIHSLKKTDFTNTSYQNLKEELTKYTTNKD